jgi:hypothetical protein
MHTTKLLCCLLGCMLLGTLLPLGSSVDQSPARGFGLAFTEHQPYGGQDQNCDTPCNCQK